MTKICVVIVNLSLHIVDLETSFLNEQEIQDITEGLIAKVMKETKGVEADTTIPTHVL